MSDYLEALRQEMAGYERAGMDERAEQVRAEIDRVTGAAAERAATVAKSEIPAQRRAPRKAHD